MSAAAPTFPQLLQKALQLVLCPLGLHRRDAKAARKSRTGWVSTCIGCGRTMTRESKGRWRVKPRRRRR